MHRKPSIPPSRADSERMTWMSGKGERGIKEAAVSYACLRKDRNERADT